MQIARDWLEELIFGGEAPRRFTQDSPVLPDVWLAYGERGSMTRPQDLLVTPYRDLHPGEVARSILDAVEPLGVADQHHGEFLPRAARGRRDRPEHHRYDIATNQAVVAVRLNFREMVHASLALSPWWRQYALQNQEHRTLDEVGEPARIRVIVRELEELSRRQFTPDRKLLPIEPENDQILATLTTVPSGRRPTFAAGFLWFVRVVGAIGLALEEATDDPDPAARFERFRRMAWDFKAQVEMFLTLLPAETRPKPSIFLISLNRPAVLAVDRSVASIKADAAIRLFNIRCDRISWAIVDSGIDATHPAFRKRDADGTMIPVGREHPSACSRVKRTFDFTRVRALLNPMSSEASYLERLREELARRTATAGRKGTDISPDMAILAKRLRTYLLEGRMLDWELVWPLLEVPHDRKYAPPANDHGTHVAGILAADWRRGDPTRKQDPTYPVDEDLIGVCPDMTLYDFRIFGGDAESSEFAIMGVLQFIRWLNERGDLPVIHGANLSLSIYHDVTNFACGRTPVCDESARLVHSGVVVVAAAGNEGRADYALAGGGRSQGYRNISISDPGNAEDVITVGATHRHQPHTYGVSYFSSRGPTGDGRSKPDLVAPGEKITAPVPGGASTKDGTSMAAPHVSGAAALLLARHRELLGDPQRVKEILCRTATDLGRERYFQGAGLVDVLRAIQSV